MTIRVADLIAAFEAWAPVELAEDWDNVGLQVGSLKEPVRHVALALDLTPYTLEQAIKIGADCVVTHHPFFFRPLKRIDLKSPEGQMLKRLLSKGISLVSLHTNLDSAREGVTDLLAQALKMKVEGALRPSPGARLYKMVVYVPKGYEEKIRQIVLESEAGVRGAYRGCTFSCEGTGSFFPEEAARPKLGEKGRLNLVAESRVEFLVPRFAIPFLVSRLKESHPYEEVPVDFYPVEGADYRFGLGRIGELPLEYTVEELAEKISEILGTEAVFVVGESQRLVRKVALCAGAGADLISEARTRGAEVFVTAEIKYHQAREAEISGFPLVLVGHFESERLVVPKMAEYLRGWAQEHSCPLEITVLEEKSPFKLIRGKGSRAHPRNHASGRFE